MKAGRKHELLQAVPGSQEPGALPRPLRHYPTHLRDSKTAGGCGERSLGSAAEATEVWGPVTGAEDDITRRQNLSCEAGVFISPVAVVPGLWHSSSVLGAQLQENSVPLPTLTSNQVERLQRSPITLV